MHPFPPDQWLVFGNHLETVEFVVDVDDQRELGLEAVRFVSHLVQKEFLKLIAKSRRYIWL